MIRKVKPTTSIHKEVKRQISDSLKYLNIKLSSIVAISYSSIINKIKVFYIDSNEIVVLRVVYNYPYSLPNREILYINKKYSCSDIYVNIVDNNKYEAIASYKDEFISNIGTLFSTKNGLFKKDNRDINLDIIDKL